MRLGFSQPAVKTFADIEVTEYPDFGVSQMKPPIKDEDFKAKIDKVARALKRARKEKSGFLHYASLIGMGG